VNIRVFPGFLQDRRDAIAAGTTCWTMARTSLSQRWPPLSEINEAEVGRVLRLVVEGDPERAARNGETLALLMRPFPALWEAQDPFS
jgi:hypothetical protein